MSPTAFTFLTSEVTGKYATRRNKGTNITQPIYGNKKNHVFANVKTIDALNCKIDGCDNGCSLIKISCHDKFSLSLLGFLTH